MKIKSVALSHIGSVRNENQDNVYFRKAFFNHDESIKDFYEMSSDSIVELDVVAVFDGMGGEKSGSEASAIAAKALEKFYMDHKSELHEVNQRLNFVTAYFSFANDKICDFMKSIQGRSGSTAAMLVLSNGKAICANLGDSRVYLYRNQRLHQLSEDHTELQMAVKAGVEFKRGKGKLVQHLGIYPDELIIEPYIQEVSVEKMDRFILCSDGLSDMVSDDIIEGYCQLELPIDRLANTLLNASLESGGKDNISMIIYDVEQLDWEG